MEQGPVKTGWPGGAWRRDGGYNQAGSEDRRPGIMEGQRYDPWWGIRAAVAEQGSQRGLHLPVWVSIDHSDSNCLARKSVCPHITENKQS